MKEFWPYLLGLFAALIILVYAGIGIHAIANRDDISERAVDAECRALRYAGVAQTNCARAEAALARIEQIEKRLVEQGFVRVEEVNPPKRVSD